MTDEIGLETATDETNIKAVDQFCSCSTHKWPDLQHRIGQLINSSSKGFIVYLDSKSCEYDWHCTAQFEQSLDTVDTHRDGAFGALHNRAILLSSLPTGHLTRQEFRQFQIMLGQAIGCGLDGQIGNGQKMLDVASDYLAQCNQRLAHLWFLSSSMGAAAIVTAFVIVIWGLRQYSEQFLGSTLFYLLITTGAGAVGALLSIILRLSGSKADPSSGRLLHFLEGGCRILAGAIGALVVGLAFKMGLLLSTFNTSGHILPALVLAGLIAGASERLVPSFIGKFDADEELVSVQRPV